MGLFWMVHVILTTDLCLSFLYLQRPESAKIDARDINGARFTVNLSGLPARVFQHEFDHLQVISFSIFSIYHCWLNNKTYIVFLYFWL